MFSLRKLLLTAPLMAFLTWGLCVPEAPARGPATVRSYPIHAGASIRPPVRPATPSRPGGAINHPSMGGARMGGMPGISHPASKPIRPSFRPTGITGSATASKPRHVEDSTSDSKGHHDRRHNYERGRDGWFGWSLMGTGGVQGAPWWSQGSAYGGTPYGWVENYPYADYETQTKPTDIIREMSRSLESEKATRSVDDKSK